MATVHNMLIKILGSLNFLSLGIGTDKLAGY